MDFRSSNIFNGLKLKLSLFLFTIELDLKAENDRTKVRYIHPIVRTVARSP